MERFRQFFRRREDGREHGPMPPIQAAGGTAGTQGGQDFGRSMRPATGHSDGSVLEDTRRSGMIAPQENTAERKVIGREQIAEAMQTLQDYKRGKATLERRIVENEQWYKLRHWESLKGREQHEPETSSAWLFNSIANKHADAMDNYPEPVVLPREESDTQAATVLTDVLPVVLEQNDFEQCYSDVWWYKLKTGTGVYGVFWDSSKLNGLGDIAIRPVDMLNLFWEPGIHSIEDSRNLFHVELVDNDIVAQRYPQMAGHIGGLPFNVAEYVLDDTVDTSKKTLVIDWYYKKQDEMGQTHLHYCKFANGTVLYASENDPQYAERGFYDHGKYPFVFDTLFPEAGTPVGFGYIDVCKSPQQYIDRLDRAILKNAVMGARPRFFVQRNGMINEDEFADWEKDFVSFTGAGSPTDSIMQIQVPQLPAAALTVRQQKIDELKETSGNRDFSQGSTNSGVTAASAIAALQEAGSKLSRDMLKSAYRAFSQINMLCIELMRQFYEEPRYFRITGNDGSMRFAKFSNAQIAPQAQGDDFGLDLGNRLPIFDVRVIAQKGSPFSTAAQNERAKELYSMGFFLPSNADQSLAALEMMEFEGIEKVRERISQNQTLMQQVQQLQQQMLQMAQILDAQNGTTIGSNMSTAFGLQAQAEGGNASVLGSGGDTTTEVNALGDAMATEQSMQAAGARTQAARNATPK